MLNNYSCCILFQNTVKYSDRQTAGERTFLGAQLVSLEQSWAASMFPIFVDDEHRVKTARHLATEVELFCRLRGV